MIRYNDDRSRKKNRVLRAGEQLDVVGVFRDNDGNELDEKLLEGAEVVMIIRNMNGVVFEEWSTDPKECDQSGCEIHWHKQSPLTLEGNKFKGKLKSEVTYHMKGEYIIELRVKTKNDLIFISQCPPLTVINDYVKRTR